MAGVSQLVRLVCERLALPSAVRARAAQREPAGDGAAAPGAASEGGLILEGAREGCCRQEE